MSDAYEDQARAYMDRVVVGEEIQIIYTPGFFTSLRTLPQALLRAMQSTQEGETR